MDTKDKWSIGLLIFGVIVSIINKSGEALIVMSSFAIYLFVSNR